MRIFTMMLMYYLMLLLVVGVCLEKGNGVEMSVEGAKKYYKLAADQGHPMAIDALSKLP